MVVGGSGRAAGIKCSDARYIDVVGVAGGWNREGTGVAQGSVVGKRFVGGLSTVRYMYSGARRVDTALAS